MTETTVTYRVRAIAFTEAPCPFCVGTGEITWHEAQPDGTLATVGMYCRCAAGRAALNRVAPWPVDDDIPDGPGSADIWP